MQFNLKKGFCFWMATWLLLANVGFAWSQSTCLITGVQKNNWHYFLSGAGLKNNHSNEKKPSVSRASCYLYQHFLVKHQASFKLENQVVEALPVSFFGTNLVPLFEFHTLSAFNSTDHGRQVLLATVRRAILQIYRI